jgi:DNA-binding MarR family transcriptional regulator
MKNKSREFQEFVNVAEQIIAKIELMHSTASNFDTGVPLYQKEIHTIQAVGNSSGINITKLAKYMHVTKGAVSQTVRKLVNKELVRKSHPIGNNKEVILELTDLGWIGFHAHEKIHKGMFDLVRNYLGDDYQPTLEKFIALMTGFINLLDKSSK